MVESPSFGGPPAHPQLLRVADAARMLSISRSLLYELMDRGQLPYTKLGRARRISRDEATGYPVVVAFMSSNLLTIARVFRAKNAERKIVVCGDDDQHGSHNSGRDNAGRAAVATAAYLAFPTDDEANPSEVSDFNDLAQQAGSLAVRQIIERIASQAAPNAPEQERNWFKPKPLLPGLEASRMPVEVFPAVALEAIMEVQQFSQAPLSLVASSCLAAMSIVVQPHIDVLRAPGLFGPVSLFLTVIADPGERKTTCDNYFMGAIREWEAKEREEGRAAALKYAVDTEVWNAKKEGAKEKLRRKSGVCNADMTKETPTEGKIAADSSFYEVDAARPEKPRIARMLFNDATPEALADNLANKFPCGALASAEAGSIFGGHSMSSEVMMRTLALLDTLWDGNPMTYDRRASDSYSVERARLTLALMIQRLPLTAFLTRNDGLARGIGFMSRWLVTYPPSTQGTRFYAPPPRH